MNHRFCVTLLIFSLIFSFYGLTYSADTPTPGANAVTEVVSGRNQNTRVWQIQRVLNDIDLATQTLSPVTVTRNIFERADGLCYQDTANNWQVSVESIQATSNVTYPYQALQGPYQIQFGAGLDTQWPIGYTVNGKIMQLGLRYLAFYDKGNNTLQPLGAINAVPPTLQGNTLTYTNIFPGVDLAYRYGKGSFEQYLVVRSLQSLPSPSQYQIDPATAYLVSVTEIYTSTFACSIQDYTGQTLQFGYLSGEGTDIYFADGSTGQALCHFAQSPAFDSSPVKQSIPMYKYLYQQNGHTFLVEGIPYSFLISASLPVTLDYNIKTGTQTGNQVWKSNTYYLSGTYTVSAPWTLVIEGGTVCKFTTGAEINVASGARILAVGTTFDYVLFTDWKDTTMGDSVSTTLSTATGGDYGTAISLQLHASANSQIQYCKIAYATDGLDIYTNLHTPIQNNIIQQCSNNGIYLSLNGTNSLITVMNNLIYSGSRYISFPAGIYAIANDTVPYVLALNNTVDGAGTGNGILGYNSAFVDCRNNLISNCFYGLSAVNGFGNAHSYNQFYQDYSNYYGLIGPGTGEGNAFSPYTTSPNGSFYLNQSDTTVVAAGDSSASNYGLQNKTTFAPVQAPNTITASTTWSQVPRNTGMVDIGYHYDPVDVVVGNTGTYSALTIGTSGVDSATLTILPGVVVSFWRDASNYTTQQIFSWAYPNIIAHGHANNRIEFNTVYATGDMMTHPLGADNLYSYLIGIHIGTNLGPNSIIENCIFRYAKAGIDLDPGTVLFHRINDNIFYDCRWGISAIDSYVRAENNLFLAGNNTQYQVLVWSATYSSNSTIIRNNTLVGNGIGWYGINAITTNGNLTCYVDIRNNIFYGFSTGVNLQPPYFVGVVSNNSFYNNSAIDYAGSLTNTNPIYSNPQLANSGSGSFDGYYLASTTGDVSRFPLQISNLSGISGSFANTPPSNAKITVTSYANGLSGSTQLGYATTLNGSSWSYISTGSGLGNILITLTSAPNLWTISSTDSITLLFGSDSIRVYFPKESTQYEPVFHWVALDGSSYYNPNNTEDAWYAMSYDTAGLAQASFSHLGTSSLVHAGDTTVRPYGSTATNQTLDSGTVNIGYHYLNRGFIQVAENNQTFEFEDGTPFIPIATMNNVPIISLPRSASDTIGSNSYLQLLQNNNVNVVRVLYHNVPIWYGTSGQYAFNVEKPFGTMIDSTAQWFDTFLDFCQQHNIYVLISVWDETMFGKQVYWDYQVNGIDMNWWKVSTTSGYGGLANIPLDIITSSAVRNQEKTTLESYINRWGDRPTIFAWDPMQELDYSFIPQDTAIPTGWRSPTDLELNTWINDVIGDLQSNELQKWGAAHLRTVSTSVVDSNTDTSYTFPFSNSNLDFLSNHYYGEIPGYGSNSSYTGPNNPIQNPALSFITSTLAPSTIQQFWHPLVDTSLGFNYQWVIDSSATEVALAAYNGVNFVLDSVQMVKPFMSDEHSPLWYNYPEDTSSHPDVLLYKKYAIFPSASGNSVDRYMDPNLDATCEHYFLWAHFASGAAGVGYRYPMSMYDTTYHNSTTFQNEFYLLNNQKYQNAFPKDLEWNGISDTMLNQINTFSSIINNLDWTKFQQYNRASNRVTVSISGDTIYAMASGDSTQMVLWLVRGIRYSYTGSVASTNNFSITLSGFDDNYGSYSVLFYDDTTGTLLMQTTVTPSSGQLTLNFGSSYLNLYLDKDMAILVKPAIW